MVFVNARLLTMDGPVIEQGAVVVKGGRIEALGSDLKPPLLAKVIDAAGKTITPGLIDAWSGLGLLTGGGATDATATAWDGFDRFLSDDFSEALRHGVTSVYLRGGDAPGILGQGVVVRLVPQDEDRGPMGELLEGASALGINLASERSPLARLKVYQDVRKQFRKALEYRESLEDYDEELKEYLEKLEERKKADEKKSPSADGDKKDEKGSNKKEPNAKDKPAPQKEPEKKPKSSADDLADNAEYLDGMDDPAAEQPRPRGPRPRPAGGDAKPAEKKDEGEKKNDKDKDELKKPVRPTPDRSSEALLKAIDHKLPVRITAHRSEDILNALALAEEFNLEVIIEGATDAYLIADRLAASEVKVVLGSVARTGRFEANQFRRHSERNAAALLRAGVHWTVGSGADEALATRFVALNAQLATAYGAQPDVDSAHAAPWLSLVTARAAELLGVERRVGRLARGVYADLVVWSGDPGDPASRVEQVYVGGKLAYPLDSDRGKGGRP